MFLGMVFAGMYPRKLEMTLIPALQSYWLKIHVSLTIVGEAVFAVAFVLGILYLVKNYRPEKITPQTKAIFINSPSNPTGNLLGQDRMQAIADLAAESGLPYIISDEIYHGLVYEGQEHSILEFTDKAFVFNGFSKLYAMTGLRLGYMIAPKTFIRAIQKVQQNFFISANAMVQMAGIAALKEAHNDVANMKAIYNKRRRFMIKRLKAMGLGITVEPTGAIYVFANAKHISQDSYKLAFDILENALVGVAPGIDFGSNGEGYLRFSYATAMEKIAEGMNRLETYLATTQHS